MIKLGFWFCFIVLSGATFGSLGILLNSGKTGAEFLHYLSVFVWAGSLLIWLSASFWTKLRKKKLLLYCLLSFVILLTAVGGMFFFKAQGTEALMVLILWTVFCIGFGSMRLYDLL